MIANVKTSHRIEGKPPNQRVVVIATFDQGNEHLAMGDEAPRMVDGKERPMDEAYHEALAKLILRIVNTVLT